MPYLWLRASNDFGASHYGIQTIKMSFNHFWMLVTFQYRGLLYLDMYCTLIIEAWLKSNIHFDCRYQELWNACIISLVFIVLNVRDGIESKYPSIVFLSIIQKDKSQCMRFPRMWYVRPAKGLIRLRIRTVWSEPLLVAWEFYDS